MSMSMFRDGRCQPRGRAVPAPLFTGLQLVSNQEIQMKVDPRFPSQQQFKPNEAAPKVAPKVSLASVSDCGLGPLNPPTQKPPGQNR
jgi:hypothetical protein